MEPDPVVAGVLVATNHLDVRVGLRTGDDRAAEIVEAHQLGGLLEVLGQCELRAQRAGKSGVRPALQCGVQALLGVVAPSHGDLRVGVGVGIRVGSLPEGRDDGLVGRRAR